MHKNQKLKKIETKKAGKKLLSFFPSFSSIKSSIKLN